jgi:hypothetical protein
MYYNCIYFHLKKLQLGPIDAAFQKLHIALKNSARANFFLFFLIFLMTVMYFRLFLLSILQQNLAWKFYMEFYMENFNFGSRTRTTHIFGSTYYYR